MEKYLKKFGGIDKSNWYLPAIIFVLSGFLLTTRLSLVPKFASGNEVTVYSKLVDKTYTFNYLIHHLSSALYLIYPVCLNYLNLHNLFLIRLSGLFCGIGAIFLFYYIAKTLTDSFIGIISTTLFATSVWFMQTVRDSSSLDFYCFAILVAIYLAILYYRKKNLRLLALASSILLGLSLYIPGMIWFSLLFIVINLKMLRLEAKILPNKIKIWSIIIFLILLGPIGYEIFKNHSLVYSILYLPHSIDYHQLLKQFINYPKYLFIQNSSASIFSIGSLPIINFATTILIIFSGIWVYRNWKNPLTKYIYLSLGLGWLLATINNNQSIYIVLPLLSLLAAIGLSYIYTEWKKIFPRNPYPDFAAKILISILVGCMSFYQILLYFIVWPHTAHILAIYTHHL
jgi:4-amino-4-deoxy-L-arabinose transferase-like glycosyltransferase